MGPIEDIVVDGIFSEGCHSAARILTTGSPIRNITIRNRVDGLRLRSVPGAGPALDGLPAATEQEACG